MKRAFFTLLVLVCGVAARAQGPVEAAPSPPPVRSTRLKIGLVLEGGGALGLAHVGVIQVLEELHIPVDFIAGTSMGGLVGGIYAAGNTPQEMKALVRQIHWNDVLRGRTPYRQLLFRRKEDRRDYPNRFEFGLKKGVQFPSGFNSGQDVGLILDQLALPYTEIGSFDQLPIPFRCVATDLETGEGHIFDRGSLGQALRATISLPAVFPPVERNGKVYVDGGLVNNLPVDVVRQMGADVVIAVHLATAPFQPHEPLSSLGVLGRSLAVVIALNEKHSLDSLTKADVRIDVDLAAFDTTDYNNFEKIEAAGYKSANAAKDMLAGLSVDNATFAAYEERRLNRKKELPVPRFIEVQGTRPEIKEGIQHELAALVNRPIEIDELNTKMTDITGLGRFNRAGYRLVDRDGKQGLLVQVDEKPYAPPTVQPLLAIDGSDFRQVLFSVGARITFLDLGGYRSELRTDVIAGSKYGLSTEYYHPLGRFSNWFVAPRAYVSTGPFNLYTDNRIFAEYRQKIIGTGVDVGYAFTRNSELRFGYDVGFQKLSRQIGLPELPTLRGRTGVTNLSYVLDRTDDPTIPGQGLRMRTQFKWLDANPGSTEQFPTVEMRGGGFQRTGERSSLFLLASGGSTVGRNPDGLPPFSLGGPLRLGAYGINELLTNQYFLFQPGYLYRLKQISPFLGDSVYLLGAYEVGKAYGSLSKSRLPQDGTGGLVIQTIFGPVFIGGSVGDHGHRAFYFAVGRLF